MRALQQSSTNIDCDIHEKKRRYTRGHSYDRIGMSTCVAATNIDSTEPVVELPKGRNIRNFAQFSYGTAIPLQNRRHIFLRART